MASVQGAPAGAPGIASDRHLALVVTAFTCAYALVAYGVTLIGSGGRSFRIGTYWPTYYLAYTFGLLFATMMRFAFLAARGLVPSAAAAADRLFGVTRSRLREIVPVLAAFPFVLAAYTTIKTSLADLGPFAWDATFAEIDNALHFGNDPWRLVNPLLADRTASEAVQFVYSAWGGVMVFSLLLAGLWEPERRRRLRFYATYFLMWPLIGNLLAWIFYSAGPVYLSAIDPTYRRFNALNAFVASVGGGTFSAHAFQQYLWTAYVAGQSWFATGISAFPSMHVALAALLLLAAWGRNRVAGAATALFLLAILVGSVHLGWHYAVDGYAAIAFTSAIWFGVGRYIDRARSTCRPGRSPDRPSGASRSR